MSINENRVVINGRLWKYVEGTTAENTYPEWLVRQNGGRIPKEAVSNTEVREK